MREGSPIQHATIDLGNGLQSGAKSLFHKILGASPCGSIFYSDSGVSKTH